MHTSTSRLLSAIAVGAAGVLLSGCGAGLDAQTTRVYNAPSGTNLRGPDVDALGSAVVITGEASAILVTGLVGPTDSDDALTGVEVTDEEGTTYTATIAGGSLEIPAGELVQTADDASIAIAGEGLAAGRLVTVRLAFERGAPIAGQVPVVDREGIYAEVATPPTDGLSGSQPGGTDGRSRPGGAEEPTDTDD